MKIAPEIQDSLELRFRNMAREMNARGERIISFGLGEPSFPTPPEIIEAAHKAMLDGFTRYSNPFGLPELRARISEKLGDENGLDVAAKNIMVTPGSKMAMSLALAALLKPGDEVVYITPCYPSYLPQIKIAEPDARARGVDLRRQDFSLDGEALAAAITDKTRAVILNSPHNPTGAMIGEGEAAALGEILREKDCYLISDEIYEKLNFSGTAHISMGSRPGLAERTITINGFSKAYSMTGWRIGYLTLPSPELALTVSRLQQHMNTNTATFIQKAALATFDLPDHYIKDYNANLAANAAALVSVADKSPNLSLGLSKGGLFAFLDISAGGLASDAFASGLLEKYAVAATPGVVFGRAWDSHVRVSLAIDKDEFAEGAARLARYANEPAAGES